MNKCTAPHAVAPTVTIVIVNYNCRDYLARCLAALSCQTYHHFSVVLVDNASSDSSIKTLEIKDKRVSLIRLEHNIGFAAANNLGAASKPADLIITLNPDAFPAPNWLEKLIDFTARHPHYAAIGSTQLLDHDPRLVDGAGDKLYFFGLPKRSHYRRPVDTLPQAGDVFSPCAAAALYRAEAFRRVGGFDESFFCYCEDVDLGFRLRLLGYSCAQAKEAVVRHVGGGSTDQISGFAETFGHRNALWMHLKNMPAPLIFFTLPCHLAAELAKALLDMINPRRGGLARRVSAVACRLKGVGEALGNMRPSLAKRRKIQRERTASVAAVAKALCWSPWRGR